MVEEWLVVAEWLAVLVVVQPAQLGVAVVQLGDGPVLAFVALDAPSSSVPM